MTAQHSGTVSSVDWCRETCFLTAMKYEYTRWLDFGKEEVLTIDSFSLNQSIQWSQWFKRKLIPISIDMFDLNLNHYNSGVKMSFLSIIVRGITIWLLETGTLFPRHITSSLSSDISRDTRLITNKSSKKKKEWLTIVPNVRLFDLTSYQRLILISQFMKS